MLERLSIVLGRDIPQQSADIVVANILAGTLIGLQPQLATHTRPGGNIILSGILAELAEAVSQAFTGAFHMQPPKQLDDWVLLESRRRQQ